MMLREIVGPFCVTPLTVPVMAWPAASVASTCRPARPLAHDCSSGPLSWFHWSARMMPHEVETVAAAAAEVALLSAVENGVEIVETGAGS